MLKGASRSVSEIKTFFRHCPSCGRRFHIQLVGRKLVEEDTINERETSTEAEMDSSLIHSTSSVTQLGEGPPVLVDVKDFQYMYKCKHCGHGWSEKHEETQTFHPRT
jgi:hypothetical protein